MGSIATPVVATFSDYQGNGAHQKSLLLMITDETPGVVHLVGGPTGYESFYIRDWYPGNWEACMGDSVYQKCVIMEDEMKHAMGRLIGTSLMVALEKLNADGET